MVAVSVGDTAPDFVLKTTMNETFRLSSLRGRRVVLFFYPMDDSLGCTLQVRALRDIYEDLTELDVEVIGINRASVDSHRSFAEGNALPFQIASDPEDAVRRLYGAFSWRLPGRVTFLVDERGIVRDVFSAFLRPLAHVKRVKTWVKES